MLFSYNIICIMYTYTHPTHPPHPHTPIPQHTPPPIDYLHNGRGKLRTEPRILRGTSLQNS